MRIGIDASRALRARRTGTERYSLELIKALLALETEHEFILYAPMRVPDRDFRTPNARVVIIPSRVPGGRLWTHTALGPYTWRHRPDVLFVPSHVLPLIGPRPSVVTVHDLGYEHFPETHPPRERWYLRWSTRRHVRVATRLIADSQATKNDLVQLYDADPERIHVVYPALDPDFRPEFDRTRQLTVRRSYGLPDQAEYILHVGTLHPRKNLARLIEAFALVRREWPERQLFLVLAGSPGYQSSLLYEKTRQLDLDKVVRFPGFVRVHDLPALYAAAACYAFPSLYEGFGFPVLEAQASAVPLVCARASSLPEVAGEGALYFDPLSVEDMTAALMRVLSDAELRAQLVAAGQANLARFSWPQTARATLAVLEEAALGVGMRAC
ncbi:MAG: glycosyltransferase family 4 protein [Caldilineales bacterium]|nr:glycosyltransferase family 4 protein [Caldilineales bacterium]